MKPKSEHFYRITTILLLAGILVKMGDSAAAGGLDLDEEFRFYQLLENAQRTPEEEREFDRLYRRARVVFTTPVGRPVPVVAAETLPVDIDRSVTLAVEIEGPRPLPIEIW